MTKPLAPFRFDIVGSFLRPDYLKEARAQFAAGNITQEELTAIEDKAIIELIEKEKAVGLNAVTDGEFRRSMWHLDFLAALDGVKEVGAEHWSVEFKGHQPKSKTVIIDGTIDFNDHPFLQHFLFTKKAAGETLVKQTIPSPTMLHLAASARRTISPSNNTKTKLNYLPTLPQPTAKQSSPFTMRAVATFKLTTRLGVNSAIQTNALPMKHEALIWTNWHTIMFRLSTSPLKTSLKILPLLFTFAVATSVLLGSLQADTIPLLLSFSLISTSMAFSWNTTPIVLAGSNH